MTPTAIHKQLHEEGQATIQDRVGVKIFHKREQDGQKTAEEWIQAKW